MSIMQGDFVEVKLTRGLVTIIDAEDFELVSQCKWCAIKGRSTFYVQRKQKSKQTVLLHRVLLNAPDGMHVDHINHNGLDNRKKNLRVCTSVENLRNSQKRKGCSSEHKGVRKYQDGRPRPWTATVQVGTKRYNKSFSTELEAALHYDEMAKEHFGEFAKLNFP